MGVVGAGMVGTHVALLGIRRGLGVSIVARDADRARERLAAAIRSTGENVEVERVPIHTAASALADADVIYEAIHERLADKRALFAAIESVVGFDVPILSGTSSLAPAQLGERMRHPDRLFVAHVVHPVTTIKLAEVLEPARPNAVARATFETWIAQMGLEPLVLDRPVTGFIVNRLQFAILREAIALVADGVVEARDIDRVVSTALAPRWVATGPLASMDLAGLELFRDIAALVGPTLENGTIVEHLNAVIAAGRTGAAAGAGFRRWEPHDVGRAVEARKRSYAFASELHAEGTVPESDPA